MTNARIVVVTGASRGLGLAIVQEFASHGWRTTGTGRSPRSANFPENAEYSQFDASDWQACESFWRQLAQQYPGATYCLVNNAGGYVSGSLLELKPGDYMQQLLFICSLYDAWIGRGYRIGEDCERRFIERIRRL